MAKGDALEKNIQKTKHTAIVISKPNFEQADFEIVGTAPFVQHKFSEKSRKGILEAQIVKSGTRGKKRMPRDIEQEYKDAQHIGEKGEHGIPCAAFRGAMIDACRAAGFVMTKAKMSVFCVGHTFDRDDGTPLALLEGKPEVNESTVRLESGVASVAIRPMWRKWTAKVRIRWDADQFGIQDVANLLTRAGIQVGVGEGRPYSKKSNGMGWGTFELVKEPTNYKTI